MTKSIAKLTIEARRLRILQTLHNATEYVADLDVLCDYLVVGMMPLIEDVGWLEDNVLADMIQTDGVTSVRITRLGKDVAIGRCQLPGVRRPEP